MATAPKSANGNRLLEKLSKSDLHFLEPHLVSVSLPLRKKLETPLKAIDDVYFMERGIASVVAVHRGGMNVEIGLVGCEGMTGCPIVMGNDRSPNSTYVQVVGEGRRISAKFLRTAMEQRPAIRLLLLKYVQAFTTQSQHTAVANARGKIHERLARWILMSHDRTPGDEMALTHEFLALMLGVRRAGVTQAMGTLKRQKLISASRGHITVLSRKGLEKVAGHFYGAPEAEYRRLFG
jgi:CRP-like cAMP-binding protein